MVSNRSGWARSIVVLLAAIMAPVSLWPLGCALADTEIPVKRYTALDVEEVQAYLGIPYAKPPVADLRWQPAQRLTASAQAIDATQYGPSCMQPVRANQPAIDMSEDCLTLNIWRPKQSKIKASLPVMVWIHGGGFVGGNGQLPGEILAKEGVVLVSLNYRLGALGFFAHPATGQSVANFGLTDVVEALQWVNRNIADFGGDKDNITVFGVSAGGMMVNLLLASRQNQGLFHKAIAQSGYITWPLPVRENQAHTAVKDIFGARLPFAEHTAQQLAINWGDNITSLSQLKSIPGKAITGRTKGFILPIVDGVTLDDQPYRLVQQRSQSVLLMTGGNSFEGSIMPYSGIPMDEYQRSWENSPVALQDLYPNDWRISSETAVQRAFGDERYLFSAYYLGRQWAQKTSPAWLYYIDYQPRDQYPGVPHGYDQQLIFNTDKKATQLSKRIGKQLREFWVKFAKAKTPNTATIKDWPSYTENNPLWLAIGDDLVPRQIKQTIMPKLLQRLEARSDTDSTQ